MTIYSTAGRGGSYTSATEPAARLAIIGAVFGPVYRLTMRGQLDADSVIALDTQLEQLASERFEEIVVDIRELRELDASGRAGLERLTTQAELRGAVVRIIGAGAGPVARHPGAEPA